MVANLWALLPPSAERVAEHQAKRARRESSESALSQIEEELSKKRAEFDSLMNKRDAIRQELIGTRACVHRHRADADDAVPDA